MNRKDAQIIMLSFFQMQTSLKFAHWRTKSYATHKALDKFLEKFYDNMDKFIEVWQGKYGRIEFDKNNSDMNLSVYQIGYDHLERYLDVLVGFLDGNKSKNCNKYKISNKTDYCGVTIGDILDKKDTDLYNIRDEILSDINQLKYLLTLK